MSFIISLRPPTHPTTRDIVLHSLEAQFTIDHLVKALVQPHDIFLTLSTTVQALILPSSAYQLRLASFLRNPATPTHESLIWAMQTVQTATMAIKLIGRTKLGYG